MSLISQQTNLITLSSSEDEVPKASSTNKGENQKKSRNPNVKGRHTGNKRKKSVKSPSNPANASKKLKRDILKLLQKQKQRLDSCISEVIISDDSSDFVVPSSAVPVHPVISDTTNLYASKSEATPLYASKNEVSTDSWVEAVKTILNETVSNRYVGEALPKGFAQSAVNHAPSSPDLFESGSDSLETSVPSIGKPTETDIVECQVDLDPFLFLSADYDSVENSDDELSGFYTEPDPFSHKQAEEIGQIENGDESSLESIQDFATASVKCVHPPVASNRTPGVVVLDGNKKQSTITSFFAGKATKPQLTFVEESARFGCTSKTKPDKPDTTVTNNNTEGYKKWNNPGTRSCPFYKKIPGTKIAVDAFNYGAIPGVEHYFLSHFHSDHYQGLNKNFRNPIYCSQVTANLVQLKLRVNKFHLRVLTLNVATPVDGVEVTPVEANHCPGAVMFIFYFPRSGYRILHTGDFRFHHSMTSKPLCQPLQEKIHEIFLDTTYLNPSYNFPSQEEVIEYVREVVASNAVLNPRVLVVCGTYTIGKEKVFMAVAEVLNCLIWTNPEKQRVLNCLDEPGLKERLTSQSSKARVHVLPMQQLTHKQLHNHLNNHRMSFDKLMAFRPTGWTHSQGRDFTSVSPYVHEDICVYNVPYSEHSSFEELEKFLKFLHPEKVIPTVNVGSQASRNNMNTYIQKWLQ